MGGVVGIDGEVCLVEGGGIGVLEVPVGDGGWVGIVEVGSTYR